MDTRRQRRQRSRDPLDRRLDQWLETGRQLVDGVAGTRPGQRGSGRTDRRSAASLGTVGRWVGDKLEWLLEEDQDDGWLEPWQSEPQSTEMRVKRPLEAISRRVPPLIQPASSRSELVPHEDDWPDESTFQVDRWQRRPSERLNPEAASNRSASESLKRPLERRPLPRSSRRRD